MLQVVQASGEDIPVRIIPGVTAASAGASILGAPLMNDFAVISLSDLMVPLEQIMLRVKCAAEGDFVICLYNPKSRKRPRILCQTLENPKRRWALYAGPEEKIVPVS